MQSGSGQSGLFLLSWSQTEIGGCLDAPESQLCVGAEWRWFGDAVDLLPATKPQIEDPASSAEDFRRRAVSAARTVLDRAMVASASFLLDDDHAERTFRLTDGQSHWTGSLIHVSTLANPLIVFVGPTPPAEQSLRVDWVETLPEPSRDNDAACVVCFTPETWIETPGGARQIEHLAAGDQVMTADGGAQEIVWIGGRQLTYNDIRRHPDLAPVRIREGAFGDRRIEGDLLVSPDHKMLLHGGKKPRGYEPEVLVSARDLVDGERAIRDTGLASVAYIHLLLERHHILLANGFETESFHPGAASLSAVPDAEKLRLFDVMPLLKVEPASYGPAARPVLSSAEAALVSAA